MDDFDLEVTPTKSLNGSVTLKNNAKVESITNFKTVTLSNSSVTLISNVNEVSISKGKSLVGSYVGTNENDTLSIAKDAILIADKIDLGKEAKDTINLAGTLILTGSSVIATKITGKGEIVATSDVYKNLDINFVNVLDLGETTTNFKGTTFESSDNTLKKATKWDPATQYDGWMGSWNDCTKEGSDAVDFIKFKANAGDTLIISNITEGNWTLFDKKGIEVTDVNIFDNNTNTFLAKGEYILQLQNVEDKSISYSVKLA